MNASLPLLENPTTGNPFALSNLPDQWTFRLRTGFLFGSERPFIF